MELKTRVKTGAVISIIGIALLALSDIPGVLQSSCLLLCFFGVYEILTVFGQYKTWKLALCAAFSVVWLVSPIKKYYRISAIALVLYCLLFLLLIIFFEKYELNKTAQLIPFLTMLPVFARCILEIRNDIYGLYYLILVVGICVSTDIAAYFIGKRFGKQHIAPRISPRKTVEGCLGGLLISVIVVFIGTTVYAGIKDLRVNALGLLIVATLSSVIGQFGDFCFSVLKRNAHAKDYGNILPGHGGILDRFDSLLFAAPFLYTCTSFVKIVK